MTAMASQITCLAIVYSTVYSDADQRKRQSSASLAFVRGIHRGPVNSPHNWPVTRKMFPLDDAIMLVRNVDIISAFLVFCLVLSCFSCTGLQLYVFQFVHWWIEMTLTGASIRIGWMVVLQVFGPCIILSFQMYSSFNMETDILSTILQITWKLKY